MNKKREQLMDIIRGEVENYAGIEGICDDADLRKAHGFDSLDIVNIVYEVCDETGVIVDDEKIAMVQTMNDICDLIMEGKDNG